MHEWGWGDGYQRIRGESKRLGRERNSPHVVNGVGGALGPHGIVPTNTQQRHVRLVEIGDDAHVTKDVRVAGVVDHVTWGWMGHNKMVPM